MIKPLLYLSVAAILIGCAGGPEERVKDYDPELMERALYGEHFVKSAGPTPDFVSAAWKKDIEISVEYEGSSEGNNGLMLQEWSAWAKNHNDKHRCVWVMWRLLDFKYITDHTTVVHVSPFEVIRLGTLRQIPWKLDGVDFAPPPSGYVYGMEVGEPDFTQETEADWCVNVLNDDEIEEK